MDDNQSVTTPEDSMVYSRGQPPSKPPRRVEDFDAIEKANIETLVDAVKYLTTTSGIALSIYSQLLQRFIASGLRDGRFAKLVAFFPLILWLMTILAGVLAIFPRKFKAETDLAKERAVVQIRKQKRFWVVICIYLFVTAFCVAVYVLAAQLWNWYPFTPGT